MMTAFFHFQHTLNRWFSNGIKLYWCQISSSSNWPTNPFKKTTLKTPSLIRVQSLFFFLCGHESPPSSEKVDWQLVKQVVYQDCYTRYQVSFYLWWIGSVMKFCKVPKYYDILFCYLAIYDSLSNYDSSKLCYGNSNKREGLYEPSEI